MNKLIIINALPTSKIFGEKLDAWWFAKNGFDVEFWDISELFFSEDKLRAYYGVSDDYQYIGPNHKVFKNRSDVLDGVEKNRKALFWYVTRFVKMDIIDDDWLLKYCNSIKIRYALQHFDPVDGNLSFADKIKKPVRRMRSAHKNRHCNPVAVVTSGQLGREQVSDNYKKAPIISIPSVKVKWAESDVKVQKPYVVFIDENIECDADALMLGIEFSSDVQGYYQRLQDLFSDIEQWLGKKVKIAASGKYIYPDPVKSFGKYEIIYGETFSLIQNADLVMGHGSLALDQAIVSKKPVVLLDDESFSVIKKDGVYDQAFRFRQEPLFISRVTLKDIDLAVKRDTSFYSDIVDKFFCEKGLIGDYREICRCEFEKLMV